MGNGYPVVQPDDLSRFAAMLTDMTRRIRELERPSGTQLADAVSQIRQLVDNLATEVANLASSGVVWAGPVADATGTGVSTTGPLTAASAVKMPAVYSNAITTAYRVVYNGNGDGSLGYNLSSRRFKQDIETYSADLEVLKSLRVVTFRYIAAVELLGDDAATEVGLIAEEVDDLGLNWLVDYDTDGLPEGIKFDRLAVAALLLAQDAAKGK